MACLWIRIFDKKNSCVEGVSEVYGTIFSWCDSARGTGTHGLYSDIDKQPFPPRSLDTFILITSSPLIHCVDYPHRYQHFSVL